MNYFDGGKYDCPICKNADDKSCTYVVVSRDDRFSFNCEDCGRYELKTNAYDWLKAKKESNPELLEISDSDRVAISCELRKYYDEHQSIPCLTIDWISKIRVGSYH